MIHHMFPSSLLLLTAGVCNIDRVAGNRPAESQQHAQKKKRKKLCSHQRAPVKHIKR